jgi:hypothetical protein
MGGEVVRRGQPGSPGSGGASPYLRRACHEQASARRMGLWRRTAPHLNAYGPNPQPLRSGSFVPFTIIGECSTDTPMQTNLSKLVRQTHQSFASVLLASSWIGLSHPHHTNSTNTRYHVNLAKPNRTRQNEDNSWYTPPRSPQFDDSMGS